MTKQLETTTSKTRVSAKYIRKMAAKYNVEIKHQLRSAEIKAYYVALVADAIIDAEIASMTDQERNINYLNELNEALSKNPRFSPWKVEYFPGFVAYIGCQQKAIGMLGVSLMGNRIYYRSSTEGCMVQHFAGSITEASTKLIAMYNMNSLRPAKAV